MKRCYSLNPVSPNFVFELASILKKNLSLNVEVLLYYTNSAIFFKGDINNTCYRLNGPRQEITCLQGY